MTLLALFRRICGAMARLLTFWLTNLICSIMYCLLATGRLLHAHVHLYWLSIFARQLHYSNIVTETTSEVVVWPCRSPKNALETIGSSLTPSAASTHKNERVNITSECTDPQRIETTQRRGLNLIGHLIGQQFNLLNYSHLGKNK